jgi:hypothetical protein
LNCLKNEEEEDTSVLSLSLGTPSSTDDVAFDDDACPLITSSDGEDAATFVILPDRAIL